MWCKAPQPGWTQSTPKQFAHDKNVNKLSHKTSTRIQGSTSIHLCLPINKHSQHTVSQLAVATSRKCHPISTQEVKTIQKRAKSPQTHQAEKTTRGSSTLKVAK